MRRRQAWCCGYASQHRISGGAASKFGALPSEAVDLIAFAHNNKLEVEGLSFTSAAQCRI